MKTPLRRLSHGLRLACVAALLLAAAAAPALAQTVQVNPATITGTIEVTGQTFSYAYVYGSWTDNSTTPPTYYSASTYVPGGGTYTLTVNVPVGSTPTYSIGAYGYLNGTNQTFYFNSQNVNPDPGVPQTADFIVNPGFIQGTVTSTGGPLNFFYIYAGADSGYFTGPTYSLLVKPGTQISVYGYGYNQFGAAQLSPNSQTVDVAAGQTITGIDWTVTMPTAPPTGSIAGTVTFAGNMTPTSLYAGASGPSSASSSTTGSFSFPDVYIGSYYMYAGASFADGSSYSFPEAAISTGRYATVSAGSTTTVDFSATQAYINGVVTLGGTNSLADVSSASFYTYGAYQTPAYGGSSYSNVTANGAYSFVVSDGSWLPSNLYLNFSKPDPGFLAENLYFYDSGLSAITVAGGETVTRNMTYATGQITVNFQALAGATFSSPQLSFNCSRVDPVTHQTIWSYSGSSYGNQQNVTSGGVTFAGMAGDCTITASAYVNGNSYVTFGTFSATLIADVIKVIDIGGPSLVVTSPGANDLVATPSVTVTGIADDEVVDIDTITVNGLAATFTSTNNAAHPHEVSFTVSVPGLSAGANTLVTVVTALPTDVAAKSTSDTRTVFYKAPAIVSANGGTFTYDATPHAGSGSATGGHGQGLPVTLTYSGTGSTSYGPSASAPTNAGTYQVVAHTDGDADTLAGDSAPAALAINKANASIVVGGYHTPYDGAPHTAIGSAKGVLLENLAGLDLSATVHTAVGSYDDPWTFTDVTGNYNDASGTVHSDIEAVAATYHLCSDGGPYGPKKSGSTIPIKLQVCDQTGASVSNVVVHATGIQLVSGTQNGSLQDSGNANPGMNFRLVGPPSSYMFNLQTKGFAVGTYNLLFTIGSDPAVNAVAFQIGK